MGREKWEERINQESFSPKRLGSRRAHPPEKYPGSDRFVPLETPSALLGGESGEKRRQWRRLTKKAMGEKHQRFRLNTQFNEKEES